MSNNVQPSCTSCHKPYPPAEEWMEWAYITRVKDLPPYAMYGSNIHELYCTQCVNKLKERDHENQGHQTQAINQIP